MPSGRWRRGGLGWTSLRCGVRIASAAMTQVNWQGGQQSLPFRRGDDTSARGLLDDFAAVHGTAEILRYSLALDNRTPRRGKNDCLFATILLYSLFGICRSFWAPTCIPGCWIIIICIRRSVEICVRRRDNFRWKIRATCLSLS